MAREHIKIEPCAADAAAVCECCGWRGTAAGVAAPDGAVLTPGDASPVGRCPECQALAYLDRPQDRARDAAPEMLAALQAIVRFGQNGTNMPQTVVGMSLALEAMRSLAIRAIAKVER